jgi:hypothetical protein
VPRYVVNPKYLKIQHFVDAFFCLRCSSLKKVVPVPYHAMKTYPLLNYVPRYEVVWESGGVSPRILNLDTRWS